ncbi:EF-Gmt [Fasciola gigantica]|uniref:EF-Gmt n=1 Tax=Fasciola gigantica TaxID=46835 RepID=A0A504YFT1_FASGI|nr:EF-Gmt [Fasciola gigantica]
MLSEVNDRRAEFIECLANADEKIGEAFLDEKPIDVNALKAGIHRAVLTRRFVPVFVGSALRNRGVQPLLDGIVDYLPNPSEINYHALDESSGYVYPFLCRFFVLYIVVPSSFSFDPFGNTIQFPQHGSADYDTLLFPSKIPHARVVQIYLVYC